MSVNISNESEDSFHNIITAVPPHRRKHILTKLKESPIYDEADLYAVCRGKTNSEMTSFLQRVLELDEINASVLAGVIIHPYEQPSRPSTAPDRPLANPQSPLHHHNMHSSHLKRLIKSTELKTYSFRFQVCQRGMRSVLKHKAMEYGFGGWVRRISATCIQSLVVFPDHAPFESTIIPFMRWLRLVDGYTPLDDDFKHSAQYVEYLRRGFIVYRIPHHVEAQLMRDHEYYSEDPDGAESIHSGNDINLPSFDATNKGSLGFKVQGQQPNEGVANVGVNVSLSVRSMYRWAAEVPKDMFLEYVIPYANVNEGRSNWRPLMLEAVQSILATAGGDIEEYSASDVALLINSALWSGVFEKNITFMSNQTPLIYDPMSILAYGYASCTGVSIFYIDALRSVGIPARLSGTPAWNRLVENGNHNWVEVWDAQHGWRFIEASPASPGETLSNPCDKWFCNPSNFANGTEVFSARFDQSVRVRFPMAWDLENKEIPGEDMTVYYQKTCNAC